MNDEVSLVAEFLCMGIVLAVAVFSRKILSGCLRK